MQHPGRVSFKFISKVQLVSGSSAGTGRWKGTGTGAGSLGALGCPYRGAPLLPTDPMSPQSSPFAGGRSGPSWGTS